MQGRQFGLYDPEYEHDACGVGFIANVDGTKSHSLVEESIRVLTKLEHRGAVGGDQKTGDGAGMLLQVPDAFFRRVLPFQLPLPGTYGAGFFFLPQDEGLRHGIIAEMEAVIASEGGRTLGWREVPVHPEALGETALRSMPAMRQGFFEFPGLFGDELERKLYVCRRLIEKRAAEKGLPMERFYIPSLSARTIIYKGMFVSTQFTDFYPDLEEEDLATAIALVHQRYSTNTFPSWPLAQPFRMAAHNGEINTLKRNMNNMIAREKTISSEVLGDDLDKLRPIVPHGGSDSAVFDAVYELLVRAGRSPEHAMMMMIPEAFGTRYHISEDKRAFYEYHAAVMEPWDGPAAMVFSDGIRIGATLDRNGLRPGRYLMTKDGTIVLASEAGVVDVAPEEVMEKGRLAPGRMLMVDTSRGRVLKDNELKASVSRGKPYRRWLEKNKIELKGLFGLPGAVPLEKETLSARQRAFGYTLEDMVRVIAPMAAEGQEPIGSMGNDTAPAVLSDRPRLLYDYFKQMFAQVTNPPIDPYREQLVMSLMSFVGRERNLLEESPEHCRQLKLTQPILTNDDIARLRNTYIPDFSVETVATLFAPREGALQESLAEICRLAEEKIDGGASLVILSDREMESEQVPVPALLATAAVHEHLVRRGKRHLAGLVVESGEAREVHHFATLVSYGASGINPYLVFESLLDLKQRGYLPEGMGLEEAVENYIAAVKKGLLKVMSKMGISTIRSYRGSQIYEAVGLSSDFTAAYFPSTPSRIEGAGLAEIERETVARHTSGLRFNERTLNHLDSGGKYRYRQGEEKHRFTPEAIVMLQRAVRSGDYRLFGEYSRLMNDEAGRLDSFRSLFELVPGDPVPISEVEPAEEIVKRFTTGAMSFGSLSEEAHTTIAMAMNRLGAMSNSGEGGEDSRRYRPLPGGESIASKVKQIASGRFGVTGEYIVNAKELQIKMAQGAKPGEGGQLPGHKVDRTIATVRRTTPGVKLISPPPHHDIYSIEDLAQLIYDLKHANPAARISVKLVSEVGVGTIAAGVAKGKADAVLISSGEGGTGASPLSSLYHAGSYWEMGLAETQQVLVANGLREHIRVQVDGQLRTGRDVVIAALMGAEEFGFGTVALVALGCVLMRECHRGSCPVGIATQDPRLRRRFCGEPEHLMNYMRFVAEEVRELMAGLGFRRFDEMVGRSDRLTMRHGLEHWKARRLDFSRILARPENFATAPLRWHSYHLPDFRGLLDTRLIADSETALAGNKSVELAYEVRNHNRTVGATLSAEVTRRRGAQGLPPGTIRVNFRGSAGQSFGAFLAPGVTFFLEGESNDYLGKGLSGGVIALYPPDGSRFLANRNIITGNVSLFGATGGEAYIRGMAGERFAVRNSGAVAVVEGVGDHGCEYMTGGAVVVLGSTGVNFAAGMSGGTAFVLDENQLFDTRCNLEMVDVEQLIAEEDRRFLHRCITRHAQYTGSELARKILGEWEEFLPHFVKVMPLEYRRAMEQTPEEAFTAGEDRDAAGAEAAQSGAAGAVEPEAGEAGHPADLPEGV
jgi:glutamate synthase domain-containing protein 2/glutamate synthase domain-containing protein 1/glutamate synthase domain-containing protein 3